MEIILPVPPNRANDSRNHWAVYRSKKDYYDECGWILKKKIPEVPFERVRLEYIVDVAKHYDWDNLSNLMKWPQDCLVANKIILSDDWLHCRGTVDQVLLPKKTDVRKLKIIIHPVSAF